MPHIAFEVDNIREAIKGHEILVGPNSPAKGMTIAFIVNDGVPVEFLQFERK